MTHYPFLHGAHFWVNSHFLIVWSLTLVLIVFAGILLSAWSDPTAPIFSGHSHSESGAGFPRQISVTDGISALIFLLFVAFYICVVFYKEDFAYYDDDMLTKFSVQGVTFPPPVWSAEGRFYPLADQEFNLLRFITRSPAGYHAFVVAELLVLLCVLFFVLNEFKIRYRALILAAAIVAPSFVVPFAGFVFPERNVFFWLAILLLCLRGYSRTKARVYFIGCLVATHFALYYKEIVVLVVVAYAVTRLMLQWDVRRRLGHRGRLDFAKENALSLGMLAVSSIYVVLFVAAVLPHRNFSYVAEHREALRSVLLAYAHTDWLPLILLVVVILRFWRFIFSSGQLDPIWDPLAVGALAYFLSLIALRLFSGYYTAPVDFIALLYLASLSLGWLTKQTRARVFVVATAFICVLLQNAAYSSFRVVERKGIITAKSRLADFLGSYLPTAKSSSVELFFPYASGFHLMELSAYLRYRGFRLVGQGSTVPGAAPQLVIESPDEFADNRCVEYRDDICTHKESAGAGTLLVVLPDDDVPTSDVENIGKNSTLLLFLRAPGICSRKWFRSLHAISAEFSAIQLPEHWLQLHVFEKTMPLPNSSFLSAPVSETRGHGDLSLQAR